MINQSVESIKILTRWWSYMKSSGITNVITNYPQGDMNVCIKFCGNPFNRHSFKSTNVSQTKGRKLMIHQPLGAMALSAKCDCSPFNSC